MNSNFFNLVLKMFKTATPCWHNVRWATKVARAAPQATATCVRPQAIDTKSSTTLSTCPRGSYQESTCRSSPTTSRSVSTLMINLNKLVFNSLPFSIQNLLHTLLILARKLYNFFSFYLVNYVCPTILSDQWFIFIFMFLKIKIQQ